MREMINTFIVVNADHLQLFSRNNFNFSIPLATGFREIKNHFGRSVRSISVITRICGCGLWLKKVNPTGSSKASSSSTSWTAHRLSLNTFWYTRFATVRCELAQHSFTSVVPLGKSSDTTKYIYLKWIMHHRCRSRRWCRFWRRHVSNNM